ncbi:MAG: tetratricopeptide repeat protein [Phycisphaerae bacterium]|nr:tetratricopeptide repeat protein [Phycisphaerae bacterium]
MRPGRVLTSVGLVAVAVAFVVAASVVLRSGPSRATGGAGPSRLALPTTIDAILGSARLLSTEGAHAKAEAILSEATRQYPDNQELRIALAMELLELRRPEEAYDQYTAALSIGPREPAIEFTAGTIANTIGRLDRAIEHYEAAQAADPTTGDYPLYLGQVLAKLGRYDAAKASLLRSAKLNEDRAVIWGTLADIALRENNAHLSASHAARARSIDPSNAVYRLIEGRALNRIGRPDEALELFIAMPPADRRDPDVMRLMSESFGLLNRPRDAALIYAAAADEDRSDGESAFRAGEWFDRAGEASQAREYLGRAALLGHEAAAAVLERIR